MTQPKVRIALSDHTDRRGVRIDVERVLTYLEGEGIEPEPVWVESGSFYVDAGYFEACTRSGDLGEMMAYARLYGARRAGR